VPVVGFPRAIERPVEHPHEVHIDHRVGGAKKAYGHRTRDVLADAGPVLEGEIGLVQDAGGQAPKDRCTAPMQAKRPQPFLKLQFLSRCKLRPSRVLAKEPIDERRNLAGSGPSRRC